MAAVPGTAPPQSAQGPRRRATSVSDKLLLPRGAFTSTHVGRHHDHAHTTALHARHSCGGRDASTRGGGKRGGLRQLLRGPAPVNCCAAAPRSASRRQERLRTQQRLRRSAPPPAGCVASAVVSARCCAEPRRCARAARRTCPRQVGLDAERQEAQRRLVCELAEDGSPPQRCEVTVN